MTRTIPAAGNSKYVPVAVLLKYLSSFWRTLKMRLLNWSGNCIITDSTGTGTFKITDTKTFNIKS